MNLVPLLDNSLLRAKGNKLPLSEEGEKQTCSRSKAERGQLID